MAIDLLSAGSAKFETAKGPTEIIQRSIPDIPGTFCMQWFL